MNYKKWIVIWAILAVSIVYFDAYNREDGKLISVCHNTEIRIINDRPMCTECKLYCEVK